MYKERRTIHVNPAAFECTIKPYWFVQPPNPPKYQTQLGTNILEPLICGSNYLPVFKQAIEQARHSIWIAIWGFDPSLPLVMGQREQKKVDNRIGEILIKRARAGVEVKLLVFSDNVVNLTEPTLLGDSYGSELQKLVIPSGYGYSYNTQWVNVATNGRGPPRPG